MLLVDDNEVVRGTLSRLLRRLGCDPTEAASGEQALSAQATADEAFDGAIVDLVMPGISGLALAAALRKVDENLPVLLSTGFGDQVGDLPPDAICGVLAKPWTLDDVRSAIERWFPLR